MIVSVFILPETPILLIDMDPQANATSGLGVEIDNKSKTIYDAIIDNTSVDKCIHKTNLKYLDIIPSTYSLVGAEIELVPQMKREDRLKNVIDQLQGKYKYIIIDSAPSLGLLTLNVLSAANSVIIPVQCEYYALEGLSQLLNTIRLVQKHLNKDLFIEGILITMYDNRLNLSKQVLQEVNQYFDDKVYKTLIKRNVRLGEAPSHGRPILLYDASSVGAQNYMELASEILGKNE